MVDKLAVDHLSLDELIRFNQYRERIIAHFLESLLKQFCQNSETSDASSN